MPKDYAKIRKNKKRKSTRKSLPRGFLIFTFLCFGGFAGLLGYIKFHAQKTPEAKAPTLITANTPAPKKTNPPAKPRFDFYTILPKMEVGETEYEVNPAVPAVIKEKSAQSITTETDATSKKALTSAISQVSKYLLQIGSYENADDADALKAKLTLLGFDVRIKKIKKDDKNFNRVVVGPFNNLASAEEAQKELQQQQINSVMLKSAG